MAPAVASKAALLLLSFLAPGAVPTIRGLATIDSGVFQELIFILH